MLTIVQPLVFIDTETTHLDLAIAQPWEIALIRRPAGAVDASADEVTHIMLATPDLRGADPEALAIGRYAERHHPDAPGVWAARGLAASMVMEATRPDEETGARAALVGSCPSYDAAVLAAFLRGRDFVPAWDHHTHDLVTWTLATLAGSIFDQAAMPMRSYELSEAVGADRPTGDAAHTALGDALWVRSWWDQLMTGVVG